MKSIQLTGAACGLFALLLTPIAAWAQVPAVPAPAAPTPEEVGARVATVVVPLVLLAIIVGAVKLYDLKRTRDEEAMVLDARISDALLVHPSLKAFPIVASARIPLSSRSTPVLEVIGTVPTSALREVAIDFVQRELHSHGSGARIEDRVVVDPLIFERVA